MKYRIVKGRSLMEGIFNELKMNPSITGWYFGRTITKVHLGNSGIAYDPKKREITIVSKKDNNLLKIFNELLHNKKVELEPI